MPYNCSTEVHLLVVNFLCSFPFSVLPPLAIEIGFTQARVNHSETQRTFTAILEKDRQSEQTFEIRIQISTPRIQGLGEPATAFPSERADFSIAGETTVIRVRLTPEDNQTMIAYRIFEDSIPENTEIFQLSSDPDPDTPNNPEFNCDADPSFRFNGRDCFPNLQVVIFDDDGESLLFIGVANSYLRTNG